MKKFIKIIIIPICILTFLLVGCNTENISAKFERLSISERKNAQDFCLDFTIQFCNRTNQEQIIQKNDFEIKLNNQDITEFSFLFEYEETFYLQPTIEANETQNIRLRVITEKKSNQISIKFKNLTLIEDEINIYK